MWIANLFRAFSVLISGSPEKIGEGYRWKSGLLVLTIFMAASFPFFNMRSAAPYQGDLPPLVPLIVGNGQVRFAEKAQSVRKLDYAEFVNENGKRYVFQDYSVLLGVERFVTAHPDRALHVEGFILKNGEGLFWPISISTSDGKVLLAPEETSKYLANRREIWGGLLLIQQISLIPLWIISFFNALNIARNFRRGEIR